MPDSIDRYCPRCAETIIECPLLPCGRVLVRVLIHPRCRDVEFDGAYHPGTLEEIPCSYDWQRWFERVILHRARAGPLERRPPEPLLTAPAT